MSVIQKRQLLERELAEITEKEAAVFKHYGGSHLVSASGQDKLITLHKRRDEIKAELAVLNPEQSHDH